VVKVSIKGTGSFLPERVLDNAYFEKLINTSDEWIVARTGIRERRILDSDKALTDMALPAAEQAMDMAGITAEDLDLIVSGTVTPDMLTPSASCVLQKRLGAHQATAFDVGAGCPGFLYALSIAQKFVADGTSKCALVVGGEVISKWTDYEDRGTCVLFGDGAGAMVIGPSTGDGEILSTHLKADGRLWDLLYVAGGGSRRPPTQESLDAREHFVRMAGNEIFKNAVRSMTQVALEAVEHNGLTIDDVDWLVPHQANLRIMEAVADRLGLPREKVIVTIDKYGNFSSGTIPVAFDEAVREGRIKRGDLVLMDAFGAGFTWGSVLIRF
jgi:3-oxoacyl-[acyl-carrier-protein] synthase-3